ncbi:MAG: chemotaxis protein CheD [Desulfuromonadia bacterium]
MKRLIQSHTEHLFLKPGEVVVSRKPMLVSTILGSCVAVTFFSPGLRIGAICHAMLPISRDGREDLRYVDSAISKIHRRMTELGAGKDLLVKLFGGATVLDGGEAGGRRTIGEQNIAVAEEILQRLGLSIECRDTGGTAGRKLLFCTRTGDVYIRRMRSGRLMGE